MTQRFFAWAGLSTAAQLAAWTGITKTQAKKATKGFIEVSVADERYIAPSEPHVPAASGRLCALPALDNLTALHGSARLHTDERDHDRIIGGFGRQSEVAIGEVRHVFDRLLSTDGRIVGTWAVKPESLEVITRAWDPAFTERAQEQAEPIQQFLAPLGHAKRHALDNDKSMARLVARSQG